MMFLSLYTILLVLVQVNVNGEENESAELTGTQCTNTYPVSHDRESPDWNLYGISSKHDENATAETCQDWCNKDVNCRSVWYLVRRDGLRYCYKFNISVQELKDTGRGNEIYIDTDTVDRPTYITYDRDCEKPLTTSSSTTKTATITKPVCSAGYERNKTVDKCQKCQTGYFKSESGDALPCFPCPRNTEATKRGAKRCEEVIEVGVIIGVVVGSVVVLAAAGFAVFYYCRKHREIPKQSPETSSEKGETKGNDYCNDYSGESGCSNSPTIVLSTSLSDTTVTTYSCTTTSDSKSIRIVSSSFSLRPRERYVVVALNEFFNKKGKENYVKDDTNDWGEDENKDEGRNVDEDGDEDKDNDGNIDEYEDGDVDEVKDGFEDEDKDGVVDEDKDEGSNVDNDKNQDEDRNSNVNEDRNKDEDTEWNREKDMNKDEDNDKDENGNYEWDDNKDENDSNSPSFDTEWQF